MRLLPSVPASPPFKIANVDKVAFARGRFLVSNKFVDADNPHSFAAIDTGNPRFPSRFERNPVNPSKNVDAIRLDTDLVHEIGQGKFVQAQAFNRCAEKRESAMHFCGRFPGSGLPDVP